MIKLKEYSKGEMNILMNKFREEADDYNIKISDEELEQAINVFDIQIKNSPNITNKELRNYSLTQLLKLVSASPSFKKSGETKIEPTPDIVYNEDGIVIYSGDVEDKCIKYGAGERWCITKGSFGNYRFDPGRKYPIFYLIKNINLPDDDPLSFIALQVRGDGNYVWTNRDNNPHESEVMNLNSLLMEIPYLNSIDNIENIIKYVPPNLGEKQKETEFKEGISFNRWSNDLDFNDKKLYLSIRGPIVTKKQSEGEYVRAVGQLFNNLSTESFVTKVLPKYDKLTEWLFQNPWIFNFDILLNNIELFKPKYQNSLLIKVNSPGHPINVKGKDILDEKFNFEISKKIVNLNKINNSPEYNLYVLDEDKIINIRYSQIIKIDILTEDDKYTDIKLSQRTEKYLFNYPEINNIPLDVLAQTIKTFQLNNSIINDVIEISRTSNNTLKTTIKIEESEFLFDLSGNKLKIYEIINNSIFPVNEDNKYFSEINNKFVKYIKNNEEIENKIINSIFNKFPLIDDNMFSLIIPQIDKEKLMKEDKGIIFHDTIYMFNTDLDKFSFNGYKYINGKMSEITFQTGGDEMGVAYGKFLNYFDIKLSDRNVKNIFGGGNRWNVNYSSKLVFSRIDNLPYSENSTLRVQTLNEKIYIVNTSDPANSYRISEKTGKLLNSKAPGSSSRITPSQLGVGERIPRDGVGRRGRPAGGSNIPIEGNISDDLQTTLVNSNLLDSFNSLPLNIRARFFGDSTRGNLRSDRGVSRRDNLLGNLGHVDYVRIVGPSAIYGIQLESGNVVASLVTQPGNNHWLLTRNGAFQLDSPSNLVAALNQRNLTEIKQYIFKEYMINHPNIYQKFKNKIKGIKKA
jgi:hypothetical protein